MTEISIALMMARKRIKRWLTKPEVQKWIAAIVLVILILAGIYKALEGKTFYIQKNVPETEVYDKTVGPVTFHITPYNMKDYSREAYNLPVSDIWSGEPMTFTLHFPLAIGVPVIKIESEGNTYFLGIDTTLTENCVLLDGDINSRTMKMLSRHHLLPDADTGSTLDFLYPALPDQFTFIPSNNTSDIPVLAGLLGLSWLQTFDNVVIDYQTQTISYNQSAICDNNIPMEKTKIWEYLFVPFSANGISETGIIDTASSTFVMRRDLGIESKLPRNFFLWREMMPALQGQRQKMMSVENVTMGNLNLGTIAAHDNLYWNYQSEERIKRMADYYSFLGYPLWKDHVIQLDFADKVFRIK